MSQRSSETQAIAIGINHAHLAHVVRRILGRRFYPDSLTSEVAVPGIDIGDKEVRGAAHLTVAGMLSEKQRQPFAGDPQEDGQARREAVLPIDLET